MFSRRFAAPCLGFTVVLTVGALQLHAQEAARPSGRDTLSAVVITATRVAVSTAAPTATTTVLRGEQLRAQGITRVLDALRLVPGAAVVASGPVGSLTSLFLRGGNSNYVRVLVDGVAVNDAGGGFDFASLTTANVDRIEIVRGPASVLYGSDAVTGVVNIFTKQGRGAPEAHALVGGGSYGTRRGELGFSGGNERGGFSLAGAHDATDGILAFNNRYVNDVLSASVRAAPDAATDARVAARWSSATYHYPTDYTGASVYRNAEQTDHRLVLSAEGGRRFSKNAEVRLSLGSNEFLPRSNRSPNSPTDTLGSYASYSRGVRTHRNAEAHLDLRYDRRGVFTVGGEVARDRERSSSTSLSQYGNSNGGFEAARHNSAAYVQVIGDATNRFSYVVGGRLDQNSAFGQFQTLRAGMAWVMAPGLRARASVGSAFKAPSFFENFSTGYVTGNPDLRPERSRSAELGVDATLADGALTLRATGYRQQFRDVIQYLGRPKSPGAPNYTNIAAADANGAELEAEYRAIPGLTLGGNYAWADTRVTTAGFDTSSGANYVAGQRLIRRPPHSFTLSAAQSLGDGGGQLQVVARRVGERDDRDFTTFPAKPVKLPAYTRLDLSAVLPLSGSNASGLSLVARIDNLLGVEYEEIARFRAPGRMTFLGVRIGK